MARGHFMAGIHQVDVVIETGLEDGFDMGAVNGEYIADAGLSQDTDDDFTT